MRKVAIGDTFMVFRRGLPRHIVDGAGICSPGKWPPLGRVELAGSLPRDLRCILERGAKDWATSLKIDTRRLVMEIAAPGKDTPSPDEALLGRLRDEVIAVITGMGHSIEIQETPGRIRFGLMAALASALGDPDSAYPIYVSRGVPVGVSEDGINNPMPRAGAIYEAKTKWSLPGLDPDDALDEGARWALNYPSARSIPAVLAKQFEEEIKHKCMMKMSLGEARRRWGPKLTIAALGAIEKSEDVFRVIFDASNTVKVNHRIRVRDQVRMPVWQDVARYLEDVSGFQGVRFAMAFDISRAHRQIPIREEDWGYLACRLDDRAEAELTEQDTLYVNTVGTFGVRSAAYWWSRLAGLASRLIYKTACKGWLLYSLMYVDDGLLLAMGPNFDRSILGALLLLLVLGFPLASRKFRGGTDVGWIGYQVNVLSGHLGITADRRANTLAWCEATAEARVILVREFRSALGKLVFVAGPLFHLRPFLGPAFSWSAAASGGTAMIPPIPVRATVKWVGIMLRDFPVLHCRRSGPDQGELFRVDAKAEGHDGAWIGGWATGPAENTGTANWFACQIKPLDFPWVFEKGQPFKVIAALELLAALYGVILLVPEADHRDGCARVRFSAGTDNQSNEHLVRRLFTTKLPLGLVCMELAAQLSHRHLDLNLVWRRREENAEADDLTNQRFEAFDPARRLDTQGAPGRFRCMPELEAATREWRRELYARCAAARAPTGARSP